MHCTIPQSSGLPFYVIFGVTANFVTATEQTSESKSKNQSESESESITYNWDLSYAIKAALAL